MVVFDLDDTLLQRRFIDVCAERFNFSQALKLLRQLDHDSLTLTKRIAAFLKGKALTELTEIADSIPLVEDVAHVIEELKRRNYVVGIISDSYQVVADRISETIGADFCLANELQFEGRVLTGEVLIPSFFHYSADSKCRHQVCKTNALQFAARKFGVDLANCIVVGDGENDICMIRNSGVGIAFCTTSQLLSSAAKQQIRERSFRKLLEYAP